MKKIQFIQEESVNAVIAECQNANSTVEETKFYLTEKQRLYIIESDGSGKIMVDVPLTLLTAKDVFFENVELFMNIFNLESIEYNVFISQIHAPQIFECIWLNNEYPFECDGENVNISLTSLVASYINTMKEECNMNIEEELYLSIAKKIDVFVIDWIGNTWMGIDIDNYRTEGDEDTIYTITFDMLSQMRKECDEIMDSINSRAA